MPLPNVRGIPAGALAAVPAKASRKNAAATIFKTATRVAVTRRQRAWLLDLVLREAACSGERGSRGASRADPRGARARGPSARAVVPTGTL